MIGKTVREIIVNEDCGSYAGYHLIIVFDDGTFFEFYGPDHINSAKGLRDADAAGYAGLFDACRTSTRYYRDEQEGAVKEDMKRKLA
jgi:hypothetical protein